MYDNVSKYSIDTIVKNVRYIGMHYMILEEIDKNICVLSILQPARINYYKLA